jgi:hypothetical protein
LTAPEALSLYGKLVASDVATSPSFKASPPHLVFTPAVNRAGIGGF